MSASPAPSFARRGYGCQREVYHPLSKRAEPTAVLYYESSDDDDVVAEVGNTPLRPGAPRSFIVTPTTGSKALVLRRGPKTTASPTPVPGMMAKKTFMPKKPPMRVVAKKDPIDHKGKGIEKRSVFLLDEMAAMEKPVGESSDLVSKRPIPPRPSTPPRQTRIPFSVLTPENTFGASSPFKIRANGAGKEQEKEKGKENGSSYNYGSIPGGFDGW